MAQRHKDLSLSLEPDARLKQDLNLDSVTRDSNQSQLAWRDARLQQGLNLDSVTRDSNNSSVVGSLIISVARIEYVGSPEDVVWHSFFLCAAVKHKVFLVEGVVPDIRTRVFFHMETHRDSYCAFHMCTLFAT